mmetsp:Transcript_50567/g.110682  ORF Transcript_50567/g.110682 Transcript_50567/m.110682 type:complete len:370 (-) Transcript_50567:1489-2598(-)
MKIQIRSQDCVVVVDLLTTGEFGGGGGRGCGGGRSLGRRRASAPGGQVLDTVGVLADGLALAERHVLLSHQLKPLRQATRDLLLLRTAHEQQPTRHNCLMHRPQKTLQIRHASENTGLGRYYYVKDSQFLQIQLRGVRGLHPADGLASLGRGAQLGRANLTVSDVVALRHVGPAQAAGSGQELLSGELKSAGGEVGSYHLGGSESASNLQGGAPWTTANLQHTPELAPGLRHARCDPLRKNHRVHLVGHLIGVEVEAELGAQAAVRLIGDGHLLRHGGSGNVPEPGMLVKMLAESVTTVSGRSVRPGGRPAAPKNHPMHPVDGRGGEIVVQGVGTEPRENINGRGGMLPNVAQDVRKPRRRVNELVHRA